MRSSDDREPVVSVVTVNYNGAHLLGELLRSLEQQTYENLEVIVVDNGSTDGSLELLTRDFPGVRVVRQTKNSGFAGGNNAGIRAAAGELVALVNNDTAAAPTWLEELVQTALEDPQIAAVGSKILFFQPFLPVRLRVATFDAAAVTGGRDPRQLGLVFGEASAFIGCEYHKPIFKEGFYGAETLDGEPVRWTMGDATAYLPIGAQEGPATLRLLTAGGEHAPPRRFRVEIGATEVATVDTAPGLREHLIEVPPEAVERERFDVINNAGTALSEEGEAEDRGIFEPDRGQYDRAEDVEAVCGAAVLFRRSALDRVGLFDRDFFMYYEDTDLSWRLRASGYRLRYQPRSTIRHLHAASSVEWSPLFTFHTARNKILMIVKNGGPKAVLRAYAAELRCIIGLSRQVWRSWRSPGAARARQELAIRLRVHSSLLWHIPRALLKRAGFLTY